MVHARNRYALVLGLSTLLGCGAPPDRLVGGKADGGTELPPDSANACETTLFDESARWAECMDFAEWEETGMGTVAFQQSEGGPCHLCHNSGVGGNYLSVDSRETFDAMHELPYLGMLVLGSYDESECFLELVRSTRLLGKDDTPSTFHPSFDWDSEREQAIVDFFDLTHAKYMGGGCKAK